MALNLDAQASFNQTVNELNTGSRFITPPSVSNNFGYNLADRGSASQYISAVNSRIRGQFTPEEIVNFAGALESDLNALISFWNNKKTRAEKIKTGFDKWRAWNQSLKTYFTTGILDEAGDSIAEIPYSGNGNGNSNIEIGGESFNGYYSTAKGNVASQFRFAGEARQFNIVSRTTESAEPSREREVRNAIENIEEILADTQNNIDDATAVISNLGTRIIEIALMVRYAETVRDSIDDIYQVALVLQTQEEQA